MASNIPYGIGRIKVWMSQLVGILGISQGGTGASTLTNKGLLVAGTSSVTTIAPSVTNGSVLVSDGTQWLAAGAASVLGSVIGSDISFRASNVTGTVAVANGGTGRTTTQSGVLKGDFTVAAFGSGGNVLTSTGAGASFSAIDLTGGSTVLNGPLPATLGGTGQLTFNTGQMFYAATSTPPSLTALNIGTAGQVLSVVSTHPAWTTLVPFKYQFEPGTASSVSEVVELGTSGSALTLPSAPATGTIMFIKDTTNTAAGSPHTITRGGTDLIESGGGTATTYSLNTNMGCVGLCYNGGTWMIISKF